MSLGHLNLLVEQAREFTTPPGRVQLRTYSIWKNMLRRCSWEHHQDYPDYGGRGIKVCDRWKDHHWHLWLGDLGVRPSNGSIDRIDVHGHYEPTNCKWASRTEQARNKRNSRFVVIGERRYHLAELAEQSGIGGETLYARIKRGVTDKEKLFKKSFSLRNEHGVQTHCKRGHEFVEANIYWHKGSRFCRTCRSARAKGEI